MHELTDPQKTQQLLELLKHRHPAPEWATFAELRTTTGGMGGERYIDLFALNTWPSKRFWTVAYEIKVSRADFSRELANPLKRHAAESLAAECYFATPAGLLQVDEIPEGWGLVVATRGGLRIKKRAQQRKVEILPMAFLASIARRLSDPPSPLPDVIWLHAGQELTQEQLLEIAQGNAQAFAHEQKRLGKEEFCRSEDYQRLVRLQDVVRRRAGFACSLDPDRLDAWLASVLAATPRSMGDVFGQLRGLRDSLNRVLSDYEATAETAAR
jgi:hypothetical protein